MKKRIWMKVTSDKYQIPLAVADSAEELAMMCHVKRGSVYSAAKEWRDGKRKNASYIAVIMEDETDADF